MKTKQKYKIKQDYSTGSLWATSTLWVTPIRPTNEFLKKCHLKTLFSFLKELIGLEGALQKSEYPMYPEVKNNKYFYLHN